MTCSTEADRNDVFTSRFEAEGTVKGPNTINLAKRSVQFFSEIFDGGSGDVIVSPLYRLKNHNQVFLVIAKLLLNDVVKFHVIDFFRLIRMVLVHRFHRVLSLI